MGSLSARRAERHCRSILRIDNVPYIVTHKLESHGLLEGISKPRTGRSGRGNESPCADNAEGLVASSTTKNRESMVLKRPLNLPSNDAQEGI